MNNEEQIVMPQFFELKEDNLLVLNPYNYEESVKRLNSLKEDYFIKDLETFSKKQFEYFNTDENSTYEINSFSFLTSIKTEEKDINLIELVNFDSYINNGIDYNEPPKSNLQFINLDGKKEIIIKSKVHISELCSNIIQNMCLQSQFKGVKRKIRELQNFWSYDHLNSFQFVIKANSINKVYYSDNKFLFDLQYPPSYKTNFLLDKKEERENKTPFEYSLFPFRNFNDEIANLKFRKCLILIQKLETTPEPNESFLSTMSMSVSNLGNCFSFFNNCNSIVASLKHLIDSSKVEKVDNSFMEKCLSESEFKKEKNFLNTSFELKDYFDYNSHDDIKKKFIELNFLHENEKIQDIYVIKLYYQILVLISENILTYYNAIELVENIIFQNKKDYKKEIFSKCTDELYPIFFNETLTRLIDFYQNIQTEFSLGEIEQKLKETFDSLYSDYIAKKIDFILKPLRNSKLIRIQRAIVTPTYTLFTPYILDQGNRILRDFLSDINLSMICVFKMDDYSENKWNNRYLIEFMKFILMKGIKIGEKNFKFLNFSQSQFRSMSCWLTTEPEKIVPLTGNYSHINVVAKYGARFSQTLTTTTKTILIPKEFIQKIDDIIIKDEEGKDKYNFSDGVGQISYSLAKKLSDFLKLDFVPSAFQGRFLGCKGVWTTMYDSQGDFIKIRPSQRKFEVEVQDYQCFELCDYSRYIQAYLNRQVILLLSALKIADQKFIDKLKKYERNLQSEKFALSLVHYQEWSSILHEMNANGINMKNDRLIKSIVENNKIILFRELKARARIYIEKSAYVIGIMDEYGILEYGEAFLHIKREDFDIILSKKATVAKCPCLHPGDIRVLSFKKFIPGNKESEKYRVFEKYENVIIFPQKGPRPHPNELSGSDLDGDNYFIFYDPDLVPEKTVEPMNYNFDNLKKKTKNKPITIKNVVKYFCEYVNLNNLGLIGDAHLAMADDNEKGALGEIPLRLAVKFSRAVDAPKTGDKVELLEDEEPKRFPHYMEKKNKSSYRSESILGQIYNLTNEYIGGYQKIKDKIKTFYDQDLCIDIKWKIFGLNALTLYKEYYIEFMTIIKKSELKKESILLTGNNIDNSLSIFSKRKNNYDIREMITKEMIEIFRKFHNKFKKGLNYILHLDDNIGKTLNQEIFFVNNFHSFSSACYMVSYNIIDIASKSITYLDTFEEELYEQISQCLDNENSNSYVECVIDYERELFGLQVKDISMEFKSDLELKKTEILLKIQKEINKVKDSLMHFLIDIQRKNIPHDTEEENESRILSFPWCISGKILSKMKLLAN